MRKFKSAKDQLTLLLYANGSGDTAVLVLIRIVIAFVSALVSKLDRL